MLYAIIERSVWGDGSVRAQDCPGVVIVHASRLNARVRDLCGRNPLAYPRVRESLRRKGRVYAAARGRGGYIIEQVAGN